MGQSRRSLADQALAAGGHASGFDYLRILLAIAISAYHSVGMTYGFEAMLRLAYGPFSPIVLFLLPAFFALSGFLVAGSLDRTKTLIGFLGLRALRIFPALIVDTLFCALVLGVVFTTSPLGEYLTSPGFYKYFLNIVGYVHFTLPGVFEHNPHPLINGQLWTIPYELECYIVLAAAALVGLTRRRLLFLLVFAAAEAFFVAGDILFQPRDRFDFTGRGLVLCFLAGVVLHLYRSRAPYSLALFAAAAAVLAGLHVVPSLSYLMPLPVAYITVYLGLTNPPKAWPLRTGDYSYGTFLYGNPIQQAVVTSIPAAKGNWLIEYPIALVCILGFAVLSWHLVEKHALAQRRTLLANEERWARRTSRVQKRFAQFRAERG